MTRLILSIVIALLCQVSSAQSPEFDWATYFEAFQTTPLLLETDINGDIVIIGKYDINNDFDPGVGNLELETIGASDDIYIVKLASNGDLIWAQRFGGWNLNTPCDMKIDNDRNIYLSGYCHANGPVYYGDIADSNVLVTQGSLAGFTLKINPLGELIWMHSITTYPYFIDVDSEGNVYTAGMFNQLTDFNHNPGWLEYHQALVQTNFVRKCDSNGNFLWVQVYGETEDFNFQDFEIDDEDKLIFTGRAKEEVDVDMSSDTAMIHLTPDCNSSHYVFKADTNLNIDWLYYTYEGEGALQNEISVDYQENIYVVGQFYGVFDFDKGNGQYLGSSPGLAPGSYEASDYLLKLDKNGSFQWVNLMVYLGQSLKGSIANDKHGGLYYTNTYRYTKDLDPSWGYAPHTSMGSYDPYFLKFDDNGNFIWAATYGGLEHETSVKITSSLDGALYLTGEFDDECDFDLDSSSYNPITPNTTNGTSYIMKIQSTLGLEEQYNSIPIFAYPNPTQDFINLSSITDFDIIGITNLLGQKQEVIYTNTILDVSSYPSGVYLIDVEIMNDTRRVIRFVKD